MAKHPDGDRLDALGKRLEAIQAEKAPKPVAPNKYTSAGLAWRMVAELVVGMAMGLGIGFGLDRLFGTQPFLLMLFALLGFAAGVRVMIQTAQDFQKQEERSKSTEG
ncbi:AtpZ/AtpI family protein [Halovulum sp. GXIMD14793]